MKKIILTIGIVLLSAMYIYQSKFVMYFFGYCADDKNFNLFCSDIIVKNAMNHFMLAILTIAVIFIALFLVFKDMKRNK